MERTGNPFFPVNSLIIKKKKDRNYSLHPLSAGEDIT